MFARGIGPMVDEMVLARRAPENYFPKRKYRTAAIARDVAVMQARLIASLPTSGRRTIPAVATLARGELAPTAMTDAVAAVIGSHGSLVVEESLRSHVSMHYNRWWRIDIPATADAALIPGWIDTISALKSPNPHQPIPLNIDGIAFRIAPSMATQALCDDIKTRMRSSGLPPVVLLDQANASADTLLHATSTYNPTLRIAQALPTSAVEREMLGLALHAQLCEFAMRMENGVDVLFNLTADDNISTEALWDVVAPIANDRDHLVAGVNRQVLRGFLRSPIPRAVVGALALILPILAFGPEWSHQWTPGLLMGTLAVGAVMQANPRRMIIDGNRDRFPERVQLHLNNTPLLQTEREMGPYGRFDAARVLINSAHRFGPWFHAYWQEHGRVPATLAAAARFEPTVAPT